MTLTNSSQRGSTSTTLSCLLERIDCEHCATTPSAVRTENHTSYSLNPFDHYYNHCITLNIHTFLRLSQARPRLGRKQLERQTRSFSGSYFARDLHLEGHTHKALPLVGGLEVGVLVNEMSGLGLVLNGAHVRLLLLGQEGVDGGSVVGVDGVLL
jgi:hypothetical protein